MKKKITFKVFCSVVGRGIWQAVCWVGGMFGIKDGSTLEKFAKRVFMVSLSAIALVIAWGLVYTVVDNAIWRYKRAHSLDQENLVKRVLSEDYTYCTNYLSSGYVVNNVTGERVLEDLVWFREPHNGDSLAVYKTNADLRGYFNIYTGKVQIDPQFKRAWKFSGGLASVMKDGKIIFIDSQGKQAFDKSFRYPEKTDGYAYHGNHCAVEVTNGNVGLIDTKGEWTLPPEYDLISPFDDKWWVVIKGDKYGLMNDSASWLMPVEYDDIEFANDGSGYFASKDGVRMRYDFEGNVLEDFVVKDVTRPEYETGEYDSEGAPVRSQANCLIYDIGNDHVGLMSLDGRPLTKAVYYSIIAISPTLFNAQFEAGEGVLLDSKGNIVN